MKKIRVVMVFMLVLVLIAGVLSGCGGGIDNSESTKSANLETSAVSSVVEENPFKDTIEFTESYWNIEDNFNNPLAKDDKIWAEVKKKFNIEIKPVNVTWEDYQNKYNIWASSGQLPDVFISDVAGTSTFVNWAKNGVIRALPDDLSAYPELQKLFEMPEIAATAIDGKKYCIPRTQGAKGEIFTSTRNCIVRKDWADNLGLKDPENADEFLNFFKTMATEDADKNGIKGDTQGITGGDTGPILWKYVAYMFNPSIVGNYWIKEDGKYIPPHRSKSMYEMLKYLRQMVLVGAVDKDFALIKGSEGRERFETGKMAGMVFYGADANSLADAKNTWDKTNPDKKFADTLHIIKIPKAADGNRYRYNFMNFWSEICFSKNVDDRKMERILTVINALASDEWVMKDSFGYEGTDYIKRGDTIVVTTPKDELGRPKRAKEVYPVNLGIPSIFGAGVYANNQDYHDADGLNQMARDYMDFLSKEAVTWPSLNFQIHMLFTPLREKYVYTYADKVIEIMMGKDDPVKMWDDYLKQDDAAGVNQMIDEMNKAIADNKIKVD